MNDVISLMVGVGAVAGILFLLWRPAWSVVLVVTMYPLEQLIRSHFSIFAEKSTLFNYIVGTLAVVAITSRMLKGHRVFLGVLNPAMLGAIVLYGLAWFGILWTPSREAATIFMIASLPYFFLVVVCVPLLLDDLLDLRRVAVGVMAIGTVIAILIMVNPSAQFWSGRLIIDLGAFGGRAGRTNPLALASMGGVMTIMATLIHFERKTAMLNVLRIAAFIFGLGLAVGSGSRGQVVAAAAVVIIFYPVARRMANPKQFLVNAMGLGVLLAGLYVVFAIFVGEANRARWDVFQFAADTQGRLDMARELLAVYLSEPGYWLLGLGTNAFTSVTSFGKIPYVHNIVAEVICEFGLVGAAALAVMLVSVWRSCRWMWLTNSIDPTMRSLAAVLGALATYTLITSLKQGSFYASPDILLWWLVAARIGAHKRRLDRDRGAELAGGLSPLAADSEDATYAGEYDDYGDYEDGNDSEDVVFVP